MRDIHWIILEHYFFQSPLNYQLTKFNISWYKDSTSSAFVSCMSLFSIQLSNIKFASSLLVFKFWNNYTAQTVYALVCAWVTKAEWALHIPWMTSSTFHCFVFFKIIRVVFESFTFPMFFPFIACVVVLKMNGIFVSRFVQSWS